MTVTASGPMSLPFAGLAELIAACPTFQAAVEVETAAEALAFIFYPECIEDDENNPPPINRVIITDSDACNWEMSQSTGQRGSVLVTFCLEADPELNPRTPAALLTFTNTVGAILYEMLQRSNTPNGSGHFWNLINLIRYIAPDLFDGRKKTSTDASVVDANYFETTFIAEYL